MNPSPHSGDKHAGFGIGMPSDNQKREWIVNQSTVNVVGGRSYKVEFYYKNYGGASVSVNVGLGYIINNSITMNPNGSGINVTMLSHTLTPPGNSDNGYTKVTSYFQAPSSGTMNFAIGAFSSANISTMQYYFVDDATISESPIISVNGTSPVCSGEGFDIQLIATNANSYSWTCSSSTGAPYNFTYSGGTAHFTGAIQNFGSSNQTYNITVVATTIGNCISTNTIPITVTPSPSTPTINGSPNLCPGNSVSLSCPFNNALTSTLQWYLNGVPIPGASGANHTTYLATLPGSYTYSVHSLFPPYCSSTSAPFVVNDITPLISVSTLPSPPTICSGNPVTLTANVSPAGGSYYWTTTGDITPSITVNPTSNTTYSCMYSVNGCTATSAPRTVAISVPSVPQFSGDQSICTGGVSIPYHIDNFQSNGIYTLTTTNGLIVFLLEIKSSALVYSSRANLAGFLVVCTRRTVWIRRYRVSSFYP